MKRIFILLLSTCVLWSCCKHEIAPDTAETTIKLSEEIASVADSIVEEAFLSSSLVNPENIAKEIKKIDGVKSATVTPSGTTIFIEQENGDQINLLLVTMDDERMFIEVPKKSTSSPFIEATKSVNKFITPNGKGKALILAPFQLSFQESLTYDKIWLESAGYKVDIYMDGAATLDRFRGSFLDDYDIVYISTHGDDTWINDVYVNAIMTGEIVNDERTKSLSDEEKSLLSRFFSPTLGKPRYCISPAWIRETSDNKFPNTWVFINACYSASDEVDESLSSVFFELGSVGFNGWQYSTSVLFSDVISPTMIKYFTQGYSFEDASDIVRDNSIANQLNLRVPFKTLDINYFIDIQNPELSDPFYLIAPCIDNEGNIYRTVKIGEQWWMAENLAYLPSVGPLSFESSTNPMYYVYDYFGTNVTEAKATDNYKIYGVLYNWAAAKEACPSGWHLPSDDEWKALETFLGMPQADLDKEGSIIRGTTEGGKLKEVGINHWNSPNTEATDEYGFGGLPGGFRPNGIPVEGQSYFSDVKSIAYFWSSTDETSVQNYVYGPWIRALLSNYAYIMRYGDYKENGFSVRCTKD